VFALVDANNMYVSCERVFNPSLANRPVVVLSSNDGAAIARSNEAKALGVAMAQPWYQIRHLERSAGLVAYSANWELIGDLSSRMMAVVARFAPRQQIYSVDESFLHFEGVTGDLVAIGRDLRATVLRETGLPTSVGFGATKTLAKLANHVAKTADRKPGSYPPVLAQVCNLGALSDVERDAVFAATEVGAVWGVGRKIGARLVESGVVTVLDLVRCDVAAIRKRYSVVLEKTVLELRGTSCLDLQEVPSAKQQILVSRSFGNAVSDLEGIVAAVSEFGSRAAERLRQQGSAACAVGAFFSTSPYRQHDAQHSVNVSTPLVRPTSDTRLLVGAALDLVHRHYREGFNYVKAGVVLIDIQPAGETQRELDLFSESDAPAAHVPERDRSALMAAMDDLNLRFGRNSVQLGSAALSGGGKTEKTWSTRQAHRSPRYTTRWAEMPTVR
jgi:DNA polymerase V